MTILICVLSACPSGPTYKGKPFTPEILLASTNTVSKTPILLASTFTVEPFLETAPKPTWNISTGTGTLAPIHPSVSRLNTFTGPDTKQVISQKIETTHEVDGIKHKASATVLVHPARLILPISGAGLPALTTTLQPRNGVEDVRIQGETVIAFGSTFDSGGINHRLELYKYSRTGALDLTFGTSGVIRIPLTDFQSINRRYEVLLDTDANLVVVTYAPGSTVVRKFNALGQADEAFGTSGTITFSNALQASDRMRGVLGDGQLFLLEERLSKPVTITRLDTLTGTADASFGGNGLVALPESFYLSAAQITPGRKLWLAGMFLGPNANRVQCLIKLNTNGTFDASFGSQGIVKHPNPQVERPYDSVWDNIRVQSDGSVIAFGTHSLEASWRNPKDGFDEFEVDTALSVTKLLPNGTLDATFGTSGTTTINVTGIQTSYNPTPVHGYVSEGKIRVVQQPYVFLGTGAEPLVMVTLSAQGQIETIARGTYDPSVVNLNPSNSIYQATIWQFEPLADGSIFTVGPLCVFVAGGGCYPNLGFSRFEP